MKHAKSTTKKHPRSVSVGHGPADKVWVGLIPKGFCHDTVGNGECGRVGGVLKGMELL